MYVQRTKPWSYTNAQTPLSYPIQFHAAEAIRIGSILALPFMPVKASEMLDAIGVKISQRRLECALFAHDYGYGRPLETAPLYIFPRLDRPMTHPQTREELEAMRARRRAFQRELRRNHLISVGRDPDTGDPLEQLVNREIVKGVSAGLTPENDVEVGQPAANQQNEEVKTTFSM